MRMPTRLPPPELLCELLEEFEELGAKVPPPPGRARASTATRPATATTLRRSRRWVGRLTPSPPRSAAPSPGRVERAGGGRRVRRDHATAWEKDYSKREASGMRS